MQFAFNFERVERVITFIFGDMGLLTVGLHCRIILNVFLSN